MFEASVKPRVFGAESGVNFPQELKTGIDARLRDAVPQDIARVEVFLNTRRMQRAVREAFSDGTARLLPQFQLVSDIGAKAFVRGIPPAIPPLRRRLELVQLVSALLKNRPDLAPHSASLELADSLAALLDEMQGEGVPFEKLRTIDVSNHSEYWAQSLQFLSIVEKYLGDEGRTAPDPEARQRLAVEAMCVAWQTAPPDHPIIVAGSTGSRGATLMFMEAVAKLPNGALILPGFDFDMPDNLWGSLLSGMEGEDHPQARFAVLLGRLGLRRSDVQRWGGRAPNPNRNKVISLSLRPAPVTNQWMTEGPSLPDLVDATGDMTLVDAPSPQIEAAAIALCLREAVETGEKAALVSPDRMLTRRVAAALDRWGITADDSAGVPLALSAPGRFLRHVGELFVQKLSAEAILVLLKHPLTNTGSDMRGDHLLMTREFELWLRRKGPPFLTPDDLMLWAKGNAARQDWASWVGDVFCHDIVENAAPMEEIVRNHISLAESIAAGPGGAPAGTLWDEAAGREALEVVNEFRREARIGGTLTIGEYLTLFESLLDPAEVRVPDGPFPDIMIWGTLEARVQGADLVILGGLNEGVWPQAPSPDPWLNRPMRHDAGLLLPDRRIGLSAHDYQQAVGAKKIILSRAARDEDAETVPSRWVNRLTNLLAGLPDRRGPKALKLMRERGDLLTKQATMIDHEIVPIPPQKRPAPCPPLAYRPRKLSVTAIEKLVRDPFAIYGRYVLKLRKTEPLRKSPDAPLKGEIVHKIVERFVTQGIDAEATMARGAFLQSAQSVLTEEVRWPATRKLWFARMERLADWFLETEAKRQKSGTLLAAERMGALFFDDIDFTLTGKADRIDRQNGGGLVLYDYKTGAPPTLAVVNHFNRQLLLEAVMAEAGAFERIAADKVFEVAYIGLGSAPKLVSILPIDDENYAFSPQSVAGDLKRLVQAYDDPSLGYASRRAMQKLRYAGDYDHLARFGEWDESDPSETEKVS